MLSLCEECMVCPLTMGGTNVGVCVYDSCLVYVPLHSDLRKAFNCGLFMECVA